MDSYTTMFTDSSQTLLIWQVYQFDSFQRYRRMQSSRTWHDTEINVRPIPKYRTLSEFWSFLIFFLFKVVQWNAQESRDCGMACSDDFTDDLFQGLCTSCLCCSCSPLPWWIWCPGSAGSTSGTVWKRWSMLAALANWNGSRMREHPNIPQLLNYCHDFISRCSRWHDAFGSLMYRSPTNPQPTKGARIFCRFPTSHCQSWGCLWGCQDFTTSMPWLDGCWIWSSYAHDTHIYTYI